MKTRIKNRIKKIYDYYTSVADIRHYITVAILAASCAFLVLNSIVCLERLVSSVQDTFRSFLYYFFYFLEREGEISVTVNELPGVDIQEYLPFSLDVFLRKIKEFPSMFFNLENLWRYTIYFLLNVNKLLILLTLLFPGIGLMFYSYFDGFTEEHIDKLRGKWIKTLYDKWVSFYRRAKAKVLWYLEYLKEHKGIRNTIIFVWILNLNLLTFVFGFFAFYFYFAASLDFSCIPFQLIKLFYDLAIMFSMLPFVLWVVIGYVLFDLIRKKMALNKLRHMERKNRGYLNK